MASIPGIARRWAARPAWAAAALWLAGMGEAHAASSSEVAQSFLWLAIILVAAKLGTLVERLGQPAVLGEILAGVALGSVALLGLPGLGESGAAATVEFLAQLGAVILLFQIGLESNIRSMGEVGARSFGVAVVGVALPFLLGTVVVGPMLLPGLSISAYLFLGATLTATSVGITGRVFRDMNVIQRPEAQIVLGAAVIDDVLGLIILSVVSAIATQGSVTASEVGWVAVQAFGFLAAALAIGQLAAQPVSRLFAGISRGHGMKITLALVICLVFAYLANWIGLAPIVGAFAAGLILENVHFRHFEAPGIKRELEIAVEGAPGAVRARVEEVVARHADRHLEDLLAPIGHLLVPVFFVAAGMQVRLEHLLDPTILGLAALLTAAAIVGKLASGIAAGNVRRWVVGWGMVPRGEVGLIFAFVGKSLGVVNEELFSVIVLMVMLTTLVTPPVLAWLLRDERKAPAPVAGRAQALDRAG